MQHTTNQGISANLKEAVLPNTKPLPSIDRVLAIMNEVANHHVKPSHKTIKIVSDVIFDKTHCKYCPVAIIELNDSVAITTGDDALTCLKNDQPITFHVWHKSEDGTFIHKLRSEQLDEAFVNALSIILPESSNG